MKYHFTIISALLIFALPLVVSAQEPGEERSSDGPIMAQSWLLIDLADETLDDEKVAEEKAPRVLFLSLDDGATLIEVATGADVIYTLVENDIYYTGALLIPTDSYEFESSLDITDENSLRVISQTQSGVFTTERNLVFRRTEVEYGVWVEGKRDLSEYSMFGECMGRVDVVPALVWVRPDPILLVRTDDEAGLLYIGDTVLSGGGGIYERVEEAEFGQFIQVITQTAVVSENSIAFTYHAIADGRDDCELRYETSFTPFDGDYDALFARGMDLSRDS